MSRLIDKDALINAGTLIYGANGRRCENCKYGFHPEYYDENTIACIRPPMGWDFIKKSDWFCGGWEGGEMDD